MADNYIKHEMSQFNKKLLDFQQNVCICKEILHKIRKQREALKHTSASSQLNKSLFNQ